MTELPVQLNATICGINVDLDALLARHPVAHLIHTSTYFLGRKAARA